MPALAGQAKTERLRKLLTYLERKIDTMDIRVFVIMCKQLGAAVRAAKQHKAVVRIVRDYDQCSNKDPRLWILHRRNSSLRRIAAVSLNA